jgi:hypothetical protein
LKGSYAGGSNVDNKRLKFFSPTLMKISGDGNDRKKLMSWPMAFAYPGQPLPPPESLPEATIPRVSIEAKEGVVIAALRFDLAATEPIVKGFTSQLLSDIKADGMKPKSEDERGDLTVAQFDALFSLNKRRNEVWIELIDHPWL